MCVCVCVCVCVNVINLPDCTHSGSYLLTLRSNTWTFPSAETAANTVEQYGAHATSPTTLLRSNVNIGSLCVCVCVCVCVCERERELPSKQVHV